MEISNNGIVQDLPLTSRQRHPDPIAILFRIKLSFDAKTRIADFTFYPNYFQRTLKCIWMVQDLLVRFVTNQ